MKFDKDDPLWKYGIEDIQICRITLKWFCKEFQEPDWDREGLVVRAQYYRFRYHEMPEINMDMLEGKEVMQVEQKDFVINSHAQWDYIPDRARYDDQLKTQVKRFMKETLFRRVKRAVSDDIEIQLLQQDIKDIKFVFDWEEIEPPKDV